MLRERSGVGAAQALALGLCLLGLATGAAAAQEGPAELVAETPYPLRGEPVELRLTTADGAPLPGVAISAHYRPNSETAHGEEVGVTGAEGTLTWVPSDAGVATLQAAGEPGASPLATAQVAVRFGAFPAVGMVVMAVAALVLFGGAAVGFRLLLAPPRPAQAVEPPST